MEKTNFYILLFLVCLTSFCNSNDYQYDDYKYDDNNYHENYDYDNQIPEDYTNDYSQGLNDYYNQNLFAPPSSPPIPPPTHPVPPPPAMGGKYLIAGWLPKMTEVVELVKTNSTPSFGQLPYKLSGAVGTMFGNAPLLCGGVVTSRLDTCISYHQDSGWIQSNLMVQAKADATGVKVNSMTFWILGGTGHGTSFLDSTEFIIQGQKNGVTGPKLPYGIVGMCAVKRSKNEIFVIGGRREGDLSSRNEVWIYDPENGFARTQGPSLTTKRCWHSCSTMKDGEKTLIITAGGWNSIVLDSIEIYDPTDNTWHSGPSLPYSLMRSPMAESPDGRGVLLFGGFTTDENGFANGRFENRILEFRAGADSWNILNVSLKNARKHHVVIPLI